MAESQVDPFLAELDAYRKGATPAAAPAGAQQPAASASGDAFLNELDSYRQRPAIAYSEGPPTAEQAAYPRVEISGTAGKPLASPAGQGDGARASAAGIAPVSTFDRYMQGVKDPFNALGQVAYNALPVSAQHAYNGLTNNLLKRFGRSERLDDGGINAFLKNQEQQYQAGRLAANGGKNPGFDGMRELGNVVNPINVPLFGLMPAAPALSAGQMIARGGVMGAVGGMATPVLDGGTNFWDDKGKQAAGGAVFGGAMAPVGNAVARVISPNTSPEVLLLMDEGVTPTAGQILGRGWARTEDKLSSWPIIGDMVKNSQRRAVEDFNRAAYNRALAPIGEESQANVGRAGVEEVRDRLGAAYDALLPQLNFRADAQFSSQLNNLSAMVNNGNVPPQVARQFDSIIRNDLVSRMTSGGTMDGQSFKSMESALTQRIKDFGASQDPAHRDISRALSEALQAARDSLTRSNPAHAPELARINEGYANYARIRQASSSLGAPGGVFTPSQLQSAVRAGDRTVGRGGFATGNALMQDLSEAGKNVLGAAYPDSGTVGRALFAGAPGAMAAAYVNPVGAALAGGIGTMVASPYTTLGQRLASTLLARRPAGAEAVSNAVRSAAPFIGATAPEISRER